MILAGGAEGSICESELLVAALTALSSSEDPDAASLPFDKNVADS